MTSKDLNGNNVADACYIRTACREGADKAYFKSLFERDWEVFVIKPDPKTGKLNGHTICCETASVDMNYGSESSSSTCG